jgi:hypothetical protein
MVLTCPAHFVSAARKAHERLDIVGRCGMNSKQNDAAFIQGNPALNTNLPEVPVQCQNDTRFGLGHF